MAQPEVVGRPESPLDRFQMVTRSPGKIRGRANRDPEGAKIKPTGVVEVNAAGSELFDRIANELGLDRNKYGVLFGGDSDQGQAAAIVVDSGTFGAAPVRRVKSKNTITVYMTELFRVHPKLRPDSIRWCPLIKEADGEGGHFVVFSLNVALERTSSRRRQDPAAEF